MVRYFYGWTPLVIVAAIFLLSMPWLGLIALMIVAIVAVGALASLAWAVVFVPYTVSRTISRRLHIRSGASRRTAPALSPAGRQNDSVWQGAPSHPAALSVGRGLHAQQNTSPEGHLVMSTIPTKGGAEVSDEDRDSDAAPTSHALFITPARWGDGFQASIHGHILELADPTDHRLAPSPHDLLIAAIASDLAWSARRFLRADGLPGDVSVSAGWQTTEGLPSLDDITLTLTVSTRAEAVSGVLAAAFANSLAARSLAEPVVHVSLEGANR
jgi:uncharacterized OsmC-like protein